MLAHLKLPGALDPQLSKTELAELAQVDAAALLADESADVLTSYAALRRYDIYSSAVIDALREAVEEKLRGEPKGSVEVGANKVVLQQSRRFDFSGDNYWSELNSQNLRLADARRSHETLLKRIAGETVERVDPETGEVMVLVGPAVEVRETLVFKF